jgi:hypothetical protein
MALNSGSIARRRRSSIRESPRRADSENATGDPAGCRGTGEYLKPEETALRAIRTSTKKANLRLKLFVAVFT